MASKILHFYWALKHFFILIILNILIFNHFAKNKIFFEGVRFACRYVCAPASLSPVLIYFCSGKTKITFPLSIQFFQSTNQRKSKEKNSLWKRRKKKKCQNATFEGENLDGNKRRVGRSKRGGGKATQRRNKKQGAKKKKR